MPIHDTICAVTTPAGVSAVGMIKVSGPSALSLVDRIFVPMHKDSRPLSQTEGYRMVYGRLMTGRFGTRVAELRDGLIRVASLLELELDFSEEDVDFVSRSELLQSCEALRAEVLALSESYRKGEAVKRGIPIAIVGSPNVGKSTLLNNLLGEDRAIVSDVEGTTRDTIEGHLFIDGQEFRLIDTAGLRETEDPVESLGIGRTLREVGSALLILWMIDPRETTEAVDEVWRKLPSDTPEVVALLNKSDETTPEERSRMSDHLTSLGVHEVIDITGRDPREAKKVTDLLHRHFANLVVAEGEVVVSNLRQAMALRRAADGLVRVEEGLKADQPTVLLAQDLRDATAAMGEVIGDVVTEDLLDSIFSHFCIGK